LKEVALSSSSQAGTRRIGYARVSTADQDLAPQLDILHMRGCDPVYSEHASGKTADRPELANAMKALPDLIATINELAQRGIAFESVTEAIDTTTAAGKLVFNIFASLAEFERHLISERTRAGLAAGRARGRMGGRPPALTSKQLREARLLLSDPNATVTEVAERYEVSRSTLYKGLRELAAKENKA
jgi:DNA invertase Pin-like site-specific DNA recombinase